MKKLILFAAASITSTFALVGASDWHVKEKDYTIKFSTSRAEGVVKGLAGVISFDERNLAASNFDVTVDVSTLNTGNGLKNRHARGEKFLNTSKYPVIRFKSSQITQLPHGYIAKGSLTIKDISRDVSIPFSFSKAGNEAMFTGNFEINRQDFGLAYRGIGEIIKIELKIPVSK